jgi:hypothetical protein
MTRHLPPILFRHSQSILWNFDSRSCSDLTSSPQNTASVCPTISGVMTTESQPQKSGQPRGAVTTRRAPRITTSPFFKRRALPTHALTLTMRNRRWSCPKPPRYSRKISFSGAPMIDREYHILAPAAKKS